MLKVLLLSLVLCGCASAPRECNLELIRARHPEMADCLRDYPSLSMDYMKTITTLEKQAGGYR